MNIEQLFILTDIDIKVLAPMCLLSSAVVGGVLLFYTQNWKTMILALLLTVFFCILFAEILTNTIPRPSVFFYSTIWILGVWILAKHLVKKFSIQIKE